MRLLSAAAVPGRRCASTVINPKPSIGAGVRLLSVLLGRRRVQVSTLESSLIFRREGKGWGDRETERQRERDKEREREREREGSAARDFSDLSQSLTSRAPLSYLLFRRLDNLNHYPTGLSCRIILPPLRQDIAHEVSCVDAPSPSSHPLGLSTSGWDDTPHMHSCTESLSLSLFLSLSLSLSYSRLSTRGWDDTPHMHSCTESLSLSLSLSLSYLSLCLGLDTEHERMGRYPVPPGCRRTWTLSRPFVLRIRSASINNPRAPYFSYPVPSSRAPRGTRCIGPRPGLISQAPPRPPPSSLSVCLSLSQAGPRPGLTSQASLSLSL